MKKTLLIIVITLLCSLMFAYPWGHRYDTEQTWQDTTIQTGTTLTFSVEWGEGDWTNSDLGYGTSTDGTGWSWTEIPWFDDGGGSNKRCKTTVQFNTEGTYYYGFRMEKPASTFSYQHGSDSWSENAGTLSAISYVIVQEPTPVVLSSFMANYYDGTPTLQWTTQSESNNLGWNIYRSSTDVYEESFRVNANIIPGAGTTSQASEYSYTDQYSVTENTTYWYWLESMDESSFTNFYGPINIEIPFDSGNNPIPPNTNIYNISNYPNPFSKHTDISFMIAQKGDLSVLIYNIKGQRIKQLFTGFISENEINKNLTFHWDGTGKNNDDIAAGIYLYVIEIGNDIYSKKMMVTKQEE